MGSNSRDYPLCPSVETTNGYYPTNVLNLFELTEWTHWTDSVASTLVHDVVEPKP